MRASRQIPVSPEDIPKIVWIIQRSVWTTKCRSTMPTFYQYCAAWPIYYQQISRRALPTLEDGFFRCLIEYGVVINPAKCKFSQIEIKFLGHLITQEGNQRLSSKREFIRFYGTKFETQKLKHSKYRQINMWKRWHVSGKMEIKNA